MTELILYLVAFFCFILALFGLIDIETWVNAHYKIEQQKIDLYKKLKEIED